MKSLRLNQGMRQDIVENIMSKWDSSNPTPEITVNRTSLKNALACDIHSKAYSGVIAKLDTTNIPLEFIMTCSYIRVQNPDEDIVNMYFGKDSREEAIEKVSTRQSKVEYVLTGEEPFYKEYKKGLEKCKQESEVLAEHKVKRTSYENSVGTVLNGVNTTKQLVEQWPEVEKFLPDNIGNPSSINLPSVNIANLNEQL